MLHYHYGYTGLPKELTLLDLAEVVDHLKNYLGNFLLDGVVTSAYLNRIASDPSIKESPPAIAALRYLAFVFLRHKPLDAQGLALLRTLGAVPDPPGLAALVRLSPADDALEERLDKLCQLSRPDTACKVLLDKLREPSATLWHADTLLSLCQKLDDPDLSWIDGFVPPPAAAGFWHSRLAAALARLGRHEAALNRWRATPPEWRGCLGLNLVAESCLALGDTAQGLALYAASLAKDPLQFPVRHRLAALGNPLRPDPDLLGRQRTVINLYSWNKAALLAGTLDSLARTDIGPARVHVLLNGCTDDSKAVVARLREERFGEALTCIELPVNIGAPAARNWLVAHPECRQADRVAFLDDDVELPRDWLTRLLRGLEDHPDAGVAGCKVLSPGRPPRLQYLFRNMAMVKDDLLRLSLDRPNDGHDSHLYDFTRPTNNVMGCCHVFRREALAACPRFDLRYSPTQMDDIAHDIELQLNGFGVLYCGEVACLHKQDTGQAASVAKDAIRSGNVIGNDIKFFHYFHHVRDKLSAMRNPTDFAFPA